jgi:hypothetical protein
MKILLYISVPWVLLWTTALAKDKFEISDEQRTYWAFQAVAKPEAAGIDAIIDRDLAVRGLLANPSATREQLVRRAYFDLIGLAPTYEEIQSFVGDPAPTAEAFESLVDKLLAMPEYGERWGRHWLDVVRYAQTNGYERDDEKPEAWRYRDYVIQSFNDDKPYRRFIMEQLAGDELPDGGDAGLVATGFYRLGVWDDEPDDKGAAEFDGLDDVIRTTTETFMALTAGCARCHDHMFDPVSQRDYYELMAFFRNVRSYDKPGDATLRDIGGGKALCVTEHGKQPRETHVLLRGDAKRKGDKVEPRLMEIFGGGELEVAPTNHSTGRRTALAKWIASESNPLTARVMANRIWLHHFGRGIVATPNDFGAAGEPPSNPALLDWLAAEFVENGWSVKHLHRVIMNTRAYQRSSAPDADNDAVDPGNLHHWRTNLRRLEAESVRDRILQISGALNRKRGGPSFYPAISGEVIAGGSRPGRGWGWSSPEEQRRRSVYAFVKRTMVYPFFEIFDYANTEGSIGSRSSTTVAPQALLLLNSELVADESARLAGQLLDSGDPVRDGFRRVLVRDPNADDRAMVEPFLVAQRAAQKELASQLAFRPDFSPALSKDYHGVLPAERFLLGPPDGWEAFKGKWGGGYEGIVNAEADQPPHRLHETVGEDIVLSGRVKLGPNTERASILMRANPKGEELVGYAATINVEKHELVLSRHRDGKVEDLAKKPSSMTGEGFVDFEASVVGDQIKFKVADTEVATRDPSPITGPGRFGVSAWGGAMILSHLSLNGERICQPQADHAERQSLAEFVSLLFNLNEFLYVD